VKEGDFEGEKGDGCFFSCLKIFRGLWASLRPKPKTWADRKLKQVLTLSFTQFHCSLPPLTQTPTAFSNLFPVLLFPPLSSFHKNTLSVWQKYFPVNLSRLCACVYRPLLGLSWKEKYGLEVITAHSVAEHSAASSKKHFKDSCLRDHLHLSLMMQIIFRWHYAEFNMPFQNSQNILLA